MKPKIYFICPNNKLISGGVKQIFRQVEVLNNHGIDAYVLLDKEPKQWWFKSQAAIAYSPYIYYMLQHILLNRMLTLRRKLKRWRLSKKSVSIAPNDILVIPEIYGAEFNKILPTNRKIIFNQNCYYTFNIYGITTNHTEINYNTTDILGAIVVSDDSLAYLNYAFPTANVYRIHIGIQKAIFNYNEVKKRQICFMPRKLSEDVTQIVEILKKREALKNWNFVSIDNKTEQEVAQIMKESVFFLSFNHREGFGLPPVEAMACGCYVIGYHGEAGREYLNPEFSTTIEYGNIIAYAKKVEEMVMAFEQAPQSVLDKGRKASEFALNEYSMERQEQDIIHTWKQILKDTDVADKSEKAKR